MADLILDEIEIPEDIKFLLLEDEEHFQSLMVGILRKIGFNGEVVKAYDVESAVKAAQSKRFDFIFLDWNLPDGLGIEFLKVVRNTHQYDQTPVVMVTTMDDIQNILDATESGSDGYIVKTYTEEEVISALSFAYKKRNNL